MSDGRFDDADDDPTKPIDRHTTESLPKTVRFLIKNYIFYEFHNIDLTDGHAFLGARCRETIKIDCGKCIIQHGIQQQKSIQ